MLPAIVLLLIFVPTFWVLIVRPQQQRQRAHLEVVAALEPGDRVESFSGIHGTLTEVRDHTVRMEVADGVVVTMARMAVATKIDDEVEDAVTPTERPEAEPAPDQEDEA